MKRLLMASCVMASASYAQDFPQSIMPYAQPSFPRFDRLSIEDGEYTGSATVEYGNDESKGSDGGWFTLTSESGIEVRVFIEVNVGGTESEQITVFPPDHLTAYPVEAVVPDGEEVFIQIMPGLS